MRAQQSTPYGQGFYSNSNSGRYGDQGLNPLNSPSGRYGDQGLNPLNSTSGRYGGQGGNPVYGQPPPAYGGYGGQGEQRYPGSYGPVFGQPPPQASYGAAGSTSGYSRYGQSGGRIRVWFPPGTDPEAIKAFEAGDFDGSGFIDANELSRVVSASVYIPFSLRTVNLMLHLFSPSGNDKIGPTEFVALWKELKDWRGVFEMFDRDRSGTIDQRELRDAFMHMGYALSNPLLLILLSKYDRTGQAKALDYDNFIECGLVVKGLTDRFKIEDKNLTGSATLKFEKFMQIVLPFIVA